MPDTFSTPTVALRGILAHSVGFVYFHGDIESQLGFDLVSCDTPIENLPLGVSKVRLLGTDRFLALFLADGRLGRRGFIVDPQSKSDMSFARNETEVEKNTGLIPDERNEHTSLVSGLMNKVGFQDEIDEWINAIGELVEALGLAKDAGSLLVADHKLNNPTAVDVFGLLKENYIDQFPHIHDTEK